MEINLKKALKLRKELEARLAKIELPLSVQVSLLVHGPVTAADAAIVVGRKAMEDKRDEITALSSALSDLRVKIASANAASGVEKILAQVANVDRVIQLCKKIADAPATPSAEILSAEINMAVTALGRDNPNRYDPPAKALSIAVVSPEAKVEAAQAIIGLKRQKEALEDQRTALNASTKIEIPEGWVPLLLELGLI